MQPMKKAPGRYLNIQTGALRKVFYRPPENRWTVERGHFVEMETWKVCDDTGQSVFMAGDLDDAEWAVLVTLEEAARILRNDRAEQEARERLMRGLGGLANCWICGGVDVTVTGDGTASWGLCLSCGHEGQHCLEAHQQTRIRTARAWWNAEWAPVVPRDEPPSAD